MLPRTPAMKRHSSNFLRKIKQSAHAAGVTQETTLPEYIGDERRYTELLGLMRNN
jgi:hypothetical protein